MNEKAMVLIAEGIGRRLVDFIWFCGQVFVGSVILVETAKWLL